MGFLAHDSRIASVTADGEEEVVGEGDSPSAESESKSGGQCFICCKLSFVTSHNPLRSLNIPDLTNKFISVESCSLATVTVRCNSQLGIRCCGGRCVV